MVEYIKRQDALSTYCTDCCVDCGDSMCADWNKIRKWIFNIPVADVAPVVHGKLTVVQTFEDCVYAKCSNCDVTQIFYHNKPLTKFCPDCGAKMDLQEVNHERNTISRQAR